ncbi:MAG TPA: hypothetical protein VGH28_17430 [Polyangiaceae bacterium]|jgi:indole-3-glycerol phosphate synthase
MSGLLERIVASKRAEVAQLGATERKAPTRATLDVPAALRRADRLALIAEVKFRSPSAGVLSRALDPGERAVAYAEAGAAMVSVLCDGPFFDGSYADLQAAREAFDARGLGVPLLAKEFVIDPLQLDQARAAGADAALVIARILEGDALGAIVRACHERGLEPFVEVIDERELARALDAGARIVGVNARDLDTLAMDAASAARVIDRIPPEVVAVHLSGLRDEDAVAAAAKTRADAALVGEALMREDDPRNILKRMLARATK